MDGENLSAIVDAEQRAAIEALENVGVRSRRHIARLVYAGCRAEDVERESKVISEKEGIRNPAALLVHRLWGRFKIPGKPRNESVIQAMEHLGLR